MGKKRKLKLLNDQFAEEQRKRLAVEKQLAKAEEKMAKLKAKEKAAKEEAAKERQLRLIAEKYTLAVTMTHQSYCSCLRSFEKYSTTVKTSELFGVVPLSAADRANMRKAAEIFHAVVMDGNGRSETEHTQPYIQKCLDAILKQPGLGNIRYHPEARIDNNQTIIVDFTIIPKSITKPSHLTSLAHIEVKVHVGKDKNSLMTDGQGQAISYLTQTLLHIDKEDQKREFRVGIFTNGESIKFMRFIDGDFKRGIMSPMLSLCKDPLKKSSSSKFEVTAGFEWLYAILLQLASTAGDRYEMIGDKHLVCTCIHEDSSVFIATVCDPIDNKEYVVKRLVHPDKHNIHLFKHEFGVYEALENSEMNLLEVNRGMSSVSECRLVFSTVCKPFVEAFDEGNSERQVELIKAVIRQLRLLHESNWYHADMRLSNIMVHDSKVYLIDFESANKLNAYSRYFPYPSIYSPKEILCNQYFAPNEFKPCHDLETFVWSLLFLVCKRITHSINYELEKAELDNDRWEKTMQFSQKSKDPLVPKLMGMLKVCQGNPPSNYYKELQRCLKD